MGKRGAQYKMQSPYLEKILQNRLKKESKDWIRNDILQKRFNRFFNNKKRKLENNKI